MELILQYIASLAPFLSNSVLFGFGIKLDPSALVGRVSQLFPFNLLQAWYLYSNLIFFLRLNVTLIK